MGKNQCLAGLNLYIFRPEIHNRFSINELQNGSYFASFKPKDELGSKTRFSRIGLSVYFSSSQESCMLEHLPIGLGFLGEG